MTQTICRGYFAFDGMPMVEVVTWRAQYRETQHVEVLELWLSLFFMQRIHKATKSLPTLKLDVTVSYVGGHAFQSCHVMTSSNSEAYNYWQNNLTTLFASWGKIDTAYQIYIFKTIGNRFYCKLSFDVVTIETPVMYFKLQ